MPSAMNPSNATLHMNQILLIERDGNRRGDLFNQRVSDVFLGLGYAEPTCNVAKIGREVDMTLRHRTEPKEAVIESKSQKEPVGGDDMNKFFGVFDMEKKRIRREHKKAVGYFVSRTGFKDSAIAQEQERGDGDIILLGPEEIIHQLIQGKVLCPLERAAAAVQADPALCLCEKVDLLCCEYGWIWVLYYSTHPRQSATHFTFVHADGHPLLGNIAEQLIESASCLPKNPFEHLEYLKAPSADDGKTAARKAYFSYISKALGEIEFEGLPADRQAGAVRVDLENIFVPLTFSAVSTDDEDAPPVSEPLSIGDVLTRSGRAAILAKPGGGKSTLIKRVALAYAFPERRLKVDDRLPDAPWFPVYIRCRDLGGDATKGVLEIMSDTARRCELSGHREAFVRLIEDALQGGRVLLLVDGLDEISSEQQRMLFVDHLRTFVAVYPTVRLLITSREAGFRAVAGALGVYCDEYSIDGLNDGQVKTLCAKWHRAVQNDEAEAEKEAARVCEIILHDPRIKALARNPMLLTTLLFVKRWLGYIPTKKCQLYSEMIKLLLVSWNAAAHEKLDLDETEPQLAFVAYYMTVHGQQTISRDELRQCIIDARKAMPEILGYTTVSPAQFIDLVEARSSLLIMQGMVENERGRLVPAYEFSHLSFQEYLTARAISEGWMPDGDSHTILEIVKTHAMERQWFEVIPLTAVLLARQAKKMIQYLIEMTKDSDDNPFLLDEKNIFAFHLANCIASEVQIGPELLEESIKFIIFRKFYIEDIQRHDLHMSTNCFDIIYNSKYGQDYCNIVHSGLFDNQNNPSLTCYSDAWIEIMHLKKGKIELHTIHDMVLSTQRERRISGFLLMMEFVFNYNPIFVDTCKADADVFFIDIFTVLLQELDLKDVVSAHAAAWCAAWAGYSERDLIPSSLNHDLLNRLVDLWINIEHSHDFDRKISWSICTNCRPGSKIDGSERLKTLIDLRYANPRNQYDRSAAIHLGFISGIWDKTQTISKIIEHRGETYIDNSRFLIDSGFIWGA